MKKATQGTGRPDMLASIPLSLATRFKILNLKRMLQRLAVAFVQVKAGNTSQNLLQEIRQIIYSLYKAKEIRNKVYKNVIKSIQI